MNESEIFERAIQITDPAHLAGFLEGSCGGNAQLRADIDALLRAHGNNSAFLERPPSWFGKNMDPTRRGDDSGGAEDSEDYSFLDASSRPDSLGRLGHYEILNVVGRGGMGVVFRAFDDKLQRIVAIKAMAAVLAADATSRKRFIREARAAAAVAHEHVVTIHAVEETGLRPYLVMSFVAGHSLDQRIQRSGPLQLQEVLRIGMQTASGLAAAHAQGIVHRDIKPANILLENGVERVRITDFGLARSVGDPGLTHHGTMTGTPSYMAPEQIRGEPMGHRADLFSLGSVMYAMCTGRAPFRGRDTIEVLKRVCDDEPQPIRELNPDAPPWLCDAVKRLHAKRPEDRFQTANQVADLLAQHLGQRETFSGTAPLLGKVGTWRSLFSRRATQALLATACALLGILWWQAFGARASGVASEELQVVREPKPAPAAAEVKPTEKAETAAPANFALEFNGKNSYVEIPTLTYDGSVICSHHTTRIAQSRRHRPRRPNRQNQPRNSHVSRPPRRCRRRNSRSARPPRNRSSARSAI